jgi:excisionase family DNA binding protein
VELTITQAAQTLDCSVDTVRRHIRRGKLTARKDDQGRYLIQFDDAEGASKADGPEMDEPLNWLKQAGAETTNGAWEDASPSNGAVSVAEPHTAPQFADEDPMLTPQRRRSDPGLDKQVARLMQERGEMVQELQMWRNEAMAAQVALEELRRLIPRTLEPKRPQGWWRFGRQA